MKLASVLLLGALGCAVATAQPTTLKLTQTIPLPGVTGRFDHFAIDVKGRRLFVAALGNNTLEVIDLAAGRRIQSVAGMSKPTGILYFPQSNQLFVANGDDGTLKILDGAGFRVVKTLPGLDDADNLRFDPKTKLAWLGYAYGALGIIDVIAQRDADTYQLRERIPTRTGARTAFFSTDLNDFYLAVPNRGDQSAELRVFQTQK